MGTSFLITRVRIRVRMDISRTPQIIAVIIVSVPVGHVPVDQRVSVVAKATGTALNALLYVTLERSVTTSPTNVTRATPYVSHVPIPPPPAPHVPTLYIYTTGDASQHVHKGFTQVVWFH